MKLEDLLKFKEWIFDNYPEIPIERLKDTDLKKYADKQLRLHVVGVRSEQLKEFACINVIDGYEKCKHQCERCKTAPGFS